MGKDQNRRVDEVSHSLEVEILSGELRPGDRLRVIPLAERFDASQSTIREALLTLERHGLAQTTPRRGTFVARLSEAEAVELCRMRALLEAYAVSVGIRAMPDATLVTMRQQIQVMQACALPRQLPQLIQADLAFHRAIADLAGSEALIQIWSTLSSRIGALIMRSVETNRLGTGDAVQYHSDVVEALATRDPATCRTAIILHYLPESDAAPRTAAQLNDAALALVQALPSPV